MITQNQKNNKNREGLINMSGDGVEDEVMANFCLQSLLIWSAIRLRGRRARIRRHVARSAIDVGKDGCALSPAIWSGAVGASGKTPRGGLRFCVKRRF